MNLLKLKGLTRLQHPFSWLALRSFNLKAANLSTLRSLQFRRLPNKLKKLSKHTPLRARVKQVHRRYFVPITLFFSAILISLSVGLSSQINYARGYGAFELWKQYVQLFNDHPNLPNNSYAGYRRGEVPLPSVPIVNSLQDFGGKGDGVTDNTAAFQAAIADAAQKGGGAIWIPAGDYVVQGLIHLKESGVVLRGESPGKTTLRFTRSLTDMLYPIDYTPPGAKNSVSQWSWAGGAIWISPRDTFNAQGQLLAPNGQVVPENTDVAVWEQWRSGDRYLAKAVKPSKRGDLSISVDSTQHLRPGMFVLMTWKHTPDYSLSKHVAGHPLMQSYEWEKATLPYFFKEDYAWPVQIARISGNTVFLKQPLRLDVQPQWQVGLKPIRSFVQESGIENLTLQFVGAPEQAKHLTNPGYNGVYLNRAINCWVKNVTIEDAENGLIMSQVKNITATDLHLAGSVKMHHGTVTRFGAADTLIHNFSISARVMHGISTEGFASGNVWSQGHMQHGTFDSHRGLPFALIRTEITTSNDGRPGGADDAGPFNGRNVVHWNIHITGKTGEFIYQPDAHVLGALVGIRGVEMDTRCGWAMVCGNKDVVVVDHGTKPIPPNLYEAQLALRRSQETWAHITYPFDRAVLPGGDLIITAEGNPTSTYTITRMEFWQDNQRIATVSKEPYALQVTRLQPGVHEFFVKMIDSSGATTLSDPIQIQVREKFA